jgi:hypothetical protein
MYFEFHTKMNIFAVVRIRTYAPRGNLISSNIYSGESTGKSKHAKEEHGEGEGEGNFSEVELTLIKSPGGGNLQKCT